MKSLTRVSYTLIVTFVSKTHANKETIKQNLMINKARLVCLLINKAKTQFSGHEHWMSCSVWEVLSPAASSSRDEECRRCLHLAVPDPEEAQTHETTATVTHSSQYSTITAQYLINVSLSLLKHTRGQWMREVTFLRRLAQDCVSFSISQNPFRFLFLFYSFIRCLKSTMRTFSQMIRVIWKRGTKPHQSTFIWQRF